MDGWLALAIFLVAGASAAPAAGLRYPVLRAAVPVTVDGDVQGDPAWQGAPYVTGFSVLGDGYAKVKQTSVQMLWQEQALYVAVVCEEPDAALLKPAVGDYSETWLEDSVEVFLQPTERVYQLGVTAGGAKGVGEGRPDIRQVTAAARIGPTSYSVEICIPATVVGATIAAGATWHGEVCRNIQTVRSGGDKFTSWTPLQSRFLEPENFATLVFRADPASAALAATLSEEVNAPYRDTLFGEIRAAAAQGEQYQAVLQQAGGDATFGETARRLLAEWGQIEALNRSAASANTAGMRAALSQVQALNRQSYQTKYKYLISKLLDDK
jgi:hypothetical protein